MKALLFSLACSLAALPAAAAAETTLIDIGALPSTQVHGVAQLTPLAVSPSGEPTVVLLDLDSGDVVPPHATESGLRLLTVISGAMSWGDGDRVDETREIVYPPGSVLTVPPMLDHWLAARSGPVRIQLIALDGQSPVGELLQQQLK